MSQARSELFIFIGAALATAIGIFVLQQLYFSYLDMSYHAQLNARGGYDDVVALREAEAQKLQSGKIPLDRAKALIAQRGRNGVGSIVPVQSEDLSAVSGWIRLHSFKPAVAHPIRTPRNPAPVATIAVGEPAPDTAPTAPTEGTR